MKKLLFVFSVVLSTGLVQAQTGIKKPGTTVKPVATANPLKTMEDSASYAVGISVANFYKQMGVKKLNTSIVSKAINDLLSGKKALMDDATANGLMNAYITKLQAQKSLPTIKTGETFLAENKKKPGVKTTASGLQYEVIIEGTGIKPTAADTFVCNYRGTFIDGREFDASANRGQPLEMPVRGVILGWIEGLQLMAIGSKYKFYVPYQLGYGASDYNGIPGGSVLIFEMELLDVKKSAAQ
jgi:FKBP-type peptidyl-prolyl cis-trans isomerase